jgi:ribosome-associated protein
MARGDLEVRHDLVIPARELIESASRAGGPGGQHVNKTSTRVTLHWNVRESAALTPEQRRRLLSRLGPRITRGGDLVIHSAGTRSRTKNREAARERLVEMLNDALRKVRRRVPTRPGAGAVDRRLAAKKRLSRTKERRIRPRNDDS